MKKNMAISLIIGSAISFIALYFAFKNVPLAALFDYLASINYFWLVPSVLFVVFAFLVRVVRWQVILASTGKISFWKAYHPMMIGFMLNCILPARVGELARPAILQQKEKVAFTAGLATVAAERVFDLIILISLSIIVFSTISIDPNLEIGFGDYLLNKETLSAIGRNMILLCTLLIAAIILISVDASRNLLKKSILGIPSLFFFLRPGVKEKISQRACAPLIKVVDNIAAGFGLIKNFKRTCICLFFSIAVWVLHAVSYYLMALGCPGIDLSFYEITAVMIIINFAIALPSVPGFWGVWEAGGRFALILFAVSKNDAAGFALASHAAQMFPVIFIGLISAVVYGVNIKNISYQKDKAS